MERKQLEAPIKDFDTGGYSDVEFISREEIEKEIPKENTITTLQEMLDSDIDIELPDVPLIGGTKLLKYFKERFYEAHGYEYLSDEERDINIFEDFKSRCGTNAVPMIKILFDNHQGKLSAVDGAITPSAFKRTAKWIQDILYLELQEEKKRKIVDNSTEGLMTSDEFLRILRVAK